MVPRPDEDWKGMFGWQPTTIEQQKLVQASHRTGRWLTCAVCPEEYHEGWRGQPLIVYCPRRGKKSKAAHQRGEAELFVQGREDPFRTEVQACLVTPKGVIPYPRMMLTIWPRSTVTMQRDVQGTGKEFVVVGVTHTFRPEVGQEEVARGLALCQDHANHGAYVKACEGTHRGMVLLAWGSTTRGTQPPSPPQSASRVVLLQEFRAPLHHAPLLLSRKLTTQQRREFTRRAAAKGGAEVAAVTFLLNEQERPLEKIDDSTWVRQYLEHLQAFTGLLDLKEPEEWKLVGVPGAPGAFPACTTSPQCTSRGREGLQTACRTAWGGSTLVVFRGEELFEATGYYPPTGADVVVKEVITLPAFQVMMQNAEAYVKACEDRQPTTTWLTVGVIQAACQNPSYEFSLPFALAVIVRQNRDVEEAYRKLLSPVGGHLRDYWEAVELLYQMVQQFTAEHCVLFELAGTFHAERKMLASAAAGRLDMALDDHRVRRDPERPVESGQDFMRTHACRLFGCPQIHRRRSPFPQG
jgi:hypothetical protein